MRKEIKGSLPRGAPLPELWVNGDIAHHKDGICIVMLAYGLFPRVPDARQAGEITPVILQMEALSHRAGSKATGEQPLACPAMLTECR